MSRRKGFQRLSLVLSETAKSRKTSRREGTPERLLAAGEMLGRAKAPGSVRIARGERKRAQAIRLRFALRLEERNLMLGRRHRTRCICAQLRAATEQSIRIRIRHGRVRKLGSCRRCVENSAQPMVGTEASIERSSVAEAILRVRRINRSAAAR